MASRGVSSTASDNPRTREGADARRLEVRAAKAEQARLATDSAANADKWRAHDALMADLQARAENLTSEIAATEAQTRESEERAASLRFAEIGQQSRLEEVAQQRQHTAVAQNCWTLRVKERSSCIELLRSELQQA